MRSIYYWKGKNKIGENFSGKETAENEQELRAALESKGLIPIKIQEIDKVSGKRKNVASKALSLLIRQMSVLISAHIALAQTFEILKKNTLSDKNSHRISKISLLLEDIQYQIQNGHSLTYALKRYPKDFNAVFCSVIDAGEKSGKLEALLKYLADDLEKMEMIRAKVQKALFYPTIVLFVALVISAGLLTWIIPQFETLFHQMRGDLPWITKYVIAVSEWFRKEAGFILLSLFVTGSSLYFLFKHSRRAVLMRDKIFLKLPFARTVVQLAETARFSRILGTLLAAGLPLDFALKSVSEVLANQVLKQSMMRSCEAVALGYPLSESLRGFFQNLVIEMLTIGEASGTLETMLARIAEIYEQSLERMLDSLSLWIEPIIMVILGLLIGSMVTAIYLPLFQMGGLF